VLAVGVLMVTYALGRGSVRMYAERRPFLQKVRPGPVWAAPNSPRRRTPVKTP